MSTIHPPPPGVKTFSPRGRSLILITHPLEVYSSLPPTLDINPFLYRVYTSEGSSEVEIGCSSGGWEILSLVTPHWVAASVLWLGAGTGRARTHRPRRGLSEWSARAVTLALDPDGSLVDSWATPPWTHARGRGPGGVSERAPAGSHPCRTKPSRTLACRTQGPPWGRVSNPPP